MYEEWFTAKAEQTYCEPTELEPFKEYLSGTIRVSEAAERLTTPSLGLVKRETASRKLYRLWSLVFDAADELPETHVALVSLVKEFRELAHIHHQYGGETIDWTNAPNFDQNWRDNYDTLRAFREEDPYDRKRWINFNAFSARIAAANLSDLDTIWGFVTITESLEAEGKSSTLLNADTRAAAAWILYAGKVMYETKNSMVHDHWTDALMKESDLWQGGKPKGFSKQRWAFWKECFSQISGDSHLSEEARVMATKAVKAMTAIEAGKEPYVE